MKTTFKLATLAFLTSSTFSVNIFAEQTSESSENENVLIVTAELKDSNVLEVATSVTVLDQQIIQQRNAQHLSEILNLAPNVNFSTGASRGRFIQIRGIGERSEFSEPVNYSVGVVLDGIDLTGISTAATTLDLQQVEILRGPQGTLYGANGLAGLINLVSNNPTEDFYASVSGSLESFGGRELSAVLSGPISDSTGYRFAVKKNVSDGYMDNVFLERSDTNNIDELSLRGKIVSELNENMALTTTVFLADIDNGYDAFSLDSNRDTYSDQPGFDRQKTKGMAFNLDWTLNEELWLETTVSYADSELGYAYDEDWSHTGICDDQACDSDLAGFDWWYSSFDQFNRDNNNVSLDIKLHSDTTKSSASSSWVVGLYLRDQQVELNRQYTYLSEDFESQFDTQNTAIYGQVDTPISEKLSLVSGLRFEKRSADYSDSNNARFSPDENLWGGKVSLEYAYHDSRMLYALISRGYKNGGFNTASSIAPENRVFDTEFQWNYEAGIKGLWLDGNLTLQASAFYQDRDDIQSKQSLVRSLDSGLLVQQGGDCPCSFTDLIENGTSGSSIGVELETRWRTSNASELYASLGYLQAEFDDFLSYSHIDADLEAIPPVPVDLSGRDVAHAPNYQGVIGLIYQLTDQLTINPEIETKDSFYFSDRHDLKSDKYELLNLRLVYQHDSWQVALYANNITDKDVQTRGFGSFGNDPRNFYDRGAYYQFAAPRVIGVSFSKEFE